MIKVGIYGPAKKDSPIRKQLLRLLLRHTDVDLRSVASPEGDGTPLAEMHPVYTGETDLRLEKEPRMDKLDVMFVIDEENLTDEILEKYRNEPEFRIIVIGDAPKLRKEPGEFVYGFAEYNRKSLVRGARAAVSPTPLALLLESALFPLAKNFMLSDGTIRARVAMPYAPTSEAEEANNLFADIQKGYQGNIEIEAVPAVAYHRLDLSLRMPLHNTVEEVEQVYNNAYDDHSFIHVVAGRDGINEDLRGSNKCLLQLYRTGDDLCINASADLLTRSIGGNAVHLMNLLFGLTERTGLNI